MHQQEVPLVHVFLEGVKSDPKSLARTQASNYADRLAKRKMAEAQEAIRERNTLLLQKGELAKEVEELRRSKAKLAKEIGELTRSKAKEIDAARAEAVESFRSSEELRSYIMDRMVDEQLRWDERLARFNPSVEINFDTSGQPPSPSPTTDDTATVIESEPAPAGAASA
ncbi:hypothetical protein ACE6H2_015666 [Prunus campanulata]